MATTDTRNKKDEGQPEDCFVIMPISESPAEPGHFRHVFDDLFVPACERAGYRAVRADQVIQTNLIQLDVLRRIVESPMALCDLSTRNPNVLFELGLRQAFDKPVVLVQEVDTPRIFDIAPLRYLEYRRELIYHQVLEDQAGIAAALLATKDAANSRRDVNSIVRLLELTQPASLQEVKDLEYDPAIQLVMAELRQLRAELQLGRVPVDTQTYEAASRVAQLGRPALGTSSGQPMKELEIMGMLMHNMDNGISIEQSTIELAAKYDISIDEALQLINNAGQRWKESLTPRRKEWFGLREDHSDNW
ncbi:MAG TPA: hypothetical protein VF826_00935 [Chloroflexia bacterium]